MLQRFLGAAGVVLRVPRVRRDRILLASVMKKARVATDT